MQYQLYFKKLGDFTWKVSECEELVEDTHRLVDQENPYLDHYHSFDRSYEIFALIPFVGILSNTFDEKSQHELFSVSI